MDDEAALLNAIAAYPEDNTPRLAYADWLDEHAEYLSNPEAARTRAEFIRLQCEIGKYEHLPSSEQQGYAGLYRRQDAILTRHWHELLGPLGDLTDTEVGFDRGFISDLRLDARRFVLHANPIAALKPLPVLTLFYVAAYSNWLSTLPYARFRACVSAAHLQSTHRPEPFVLGMEDTRLLLVDGPSWGRLKILNLGGSQIGDAGFELLAGSTALPVLTDLDLSGNEVSDAGVRMLVDSPLWPRLKYLVLGANPISDEGAFALVDAPHTGIEYLNLKYTAITRAGQQRLLRRKGWKVDLF